MPLPEPWHYTPSNRAFNGHATLERSKPDDVVIVSDTEFGLTRIMYHNANGSVVALHDLPNKHQLVAKLKQLLLPSVPEHLLDLLPN